jgi:hypothetical protein
MRNANLLRHAIEMSPSSPELFSGLTRGLTRDPGRPPSVDCNSKAYWMPAFAGMTAATNPSLVIAGLDPAIQGRFLDVC